MKSTFFSVRSFVLLFVVLVCVLSCQRNDHPVKWRIAFSHISTTDPLQREIFTQIKRGLGSKPELKLITANARDKVSLQVSHIEWFIRQRVNVLIVAGKESKALAAVLSEARAAGIKVVVLENAVHAGSYDCLVAADNMEIGRQVGRTVVDLLGGRGKARGKVVEIWGNMDAVSALDRHTGLHEIIDREPRIKKIVDRRDGDWKEERAYSIMTDVLAAEAEIDLVFAHNDAMAYGAFRAAEEAGRSEEITFIGVNGLPDVGCRRVAEGELFATFRYEAPGEKGAASAIAMLEGKKVPKNILLSVQKITGKNVGEFIE